MQEFPLKVDAVTNTLARAMCKACDVILLEYYYMPTPPQVYTMYEIAKEAHVLTEQHRSNMILHKLGE